MIASIFRDAHRTLLWMSLALWFLSLALPGASEGHGVDCSARSWAPGWMLLIGGPLGALVGQFGWFANPLMLLAAIFKRSELAVLAVGLVVLTAFTLNSVPTDNGSNTVCGFGPGYYVWLACAVLILYSTLLTPRPAPKTIGDRSEFDEEVH